MSIKTKFNGLLFVSIVVSLLAAGGCASREKCSADKKTNLWNGKDLTGWKMVVADANVDVNKVWSVRNGVIRCEGKPSGYIRTEKDYSNYKLHVEWRWAEKPTNSGVLLHMSGEDKVWPKAIELQLMSGNAGDVYFIGDTSAKSDVPQKGRKIPKREKSSEKPAGQWNTYNIICKGNTIKAYVNSVLQADITDTSVDSGKICLQSEGSPIEFRNIYIERVK